jgi:hypothetical protein
MVVEPDYQTVRSTTVVRLTPLVVVNHVNKPRTLLPLQHLLLRGSEAQGITCSPSTPGWKWFTHGRGRTQVYHVRIGVYQSVLQCVERETRNVVPDFIY